MRSFCAYQLFVLVLLSISRLSVSQNATNETMIDNDDVLDTILGDVIDAIIDTVMTEMPTEDTMATSAPTENDGLGPMDKDPATLAPTEVVIEIPAETASPSMRGTAAATTTEATITDDMGDMEATQTPSESDGIEDFPETEEPMTEAPLTDAPLMEAPLTEAPLTEAPLTEAPLTEAPTDAITEILITEAPTGAILTDAPVLTVAPTIITVENVTVPMPNSTDVAVVDELPDGSVGNDTDSVQGGSVGGDDEETTATDAGLEPSLAPVAAGECAFQPIGNTNTACQQLLKFTTVTCDCSVFCSGGLVVCIPFGERTSFSCSGETVAGCTEAQRTSGAVGQSSRMLSTLLLSIVVAGTALS